MAFSQDSIFYKSFDLESYKKIMSDPNQLKKLIDNAFGNKNECSETKFLIEASNIFGKDVEVLKKILLFEETNPATFPCFLSIKNNSDKIVLLDYNLTGLLYLVLHGILEKKTFDQETAKRGKIF